MKKYVLFLYFLPIFLFSGVFEHLLNTDKNYLFEHNFRCHGSICIASEKNIYDNPIMEDAIKVVKTFLDHKEKVFKIEIELLFKNEQKEAFYNALIKSSTDNENIEYKKYELNDKYGNHSFVDITNKKREKEYIDFLTNKYYNIMKSYKN